MCEDPLDEPEGVLLGHIYAARKVGIKAVKRASIEVYKPGGALLDVNSVPASTEGAASIKVIGVAKEATTAEPKALELRVEGKVWHGLKPLLPLSQKDSGEPGLPLQEALRVGMCRHNWLP